MLGDRPNSSFGWDKSGDQVSVVFSILCVLETNEEKQLFCHSSLKLLVLVVLCHQLVLY